MSSGGPEFHNIAPNTGQRYTLKQPGEQSANAQEGLTAFGMFGATSASTTSHPARKDFKTRNKNNEIVTETRYNDSLGDRLSNWLRRKLETRALPGMSKNTPPAGSIVDQKGT